MIAPRRRIALGITAVVALAATTACGADAASAPLASVSTSQPTVPLSSPPTIAAPPPSPAEIASPPATPAPAPSISVAPATAMAPAAGVAPARMIIPSFDIDMPVSAQGVDDAGLMALPPHPSEAGWYRFGPAPGDPEGATVIAGHVDSKEYGIGPLAALRRVNPGAEIIVITQEGREHRYRAESVESVPVAELDLGELFSRTGPARLHVVTCSGAYLPEQGGYQNNLIVHAVPES